MLYVLLEVFNFLVIGHSEATCISILLLQVEESLLERAEKYEVFKEERVEAGYSRPVGTIII